MQPQHDPQTEAILILIVDDRSENLQALEALIDFPETLLIRAESGFKALDVLLENPGIELIVMDVRMPEMDGYATAELIRGRKSTAHIPILFVTASERSEEKIFQGYRAGAVDYLVKPLNPDIVRGKIKVFVELARQRRLIQQKMELIATLNTELEARVQRRTEQLQWQSNRLQALVEQLATTEQRERKRISAILHDHVQQLLVATTFQLGEAARLASKQGLPEASECVRRGKDFLKEAIEATRSLAVELCPPALREVGLAAALQWLKTKLHAEQGLEVLLDLDDGEAELPESLKILLFEAAREMLFNVVKHAGVHQAILRYRAGLENGVELDVADEGHGFTVSPTDEKFSQQQGLGLFNLKERLRALSARFEITTAPGRGSRIVVRVPASAFGETNAKDDK